MEKKIKDHASRVITCRIPNKSVTSMIYTVLIAVLLILEGTDASRAATGQVCPSMTGQRVFSIVLSDGGPPLPDQSNTETPGGDTYELPPGVKGGYFADCAYVPASSPTVPSPQSITHKVLKLPVDYKICKGSDHPMQITCK